VARRLRRLALLESTCQHRSENFVPPAAQRYAVGRTVISRFLLRYSLRIDESSFMNCRKAKPHILKRKS